MTLEEMKQTVDLLDYVQSQGREARRVGANKYRVDPCPVCGHKGHFTIYPDSNSYNSFNDCCKGGSVLDYLIEVEGLEQPAAINKLKQLAGDNVVNLDKIKPPTNSQQPGAAQVTKAAEASVDYTDLIRKLYHKRGPESDQYFKDQGISADLIEKYRLTWGPVPGAKDTRPRALYSSWENGRCIHVSGRALKEGQEPKYLNVTGQKPIFNAERIQEAGPGEVVILTEGIKDALLIESLTGEPALALQGCSSTTAKEAVKESKGVILTAFDNDEPGQKTTSDFKGYQAIEIPPKYKDPGEWGAKDHESLKKAFKDVIEQIKIIGSMAEYLEYQFFVDLEKNTSAARPSTGLKQLDNALNGGMYPGLYFLGGQTGAGKTSFAMQLAETIAAQQQPVLFISLEMGRFELAGRSLARLMYIDGRQEWTTGHILNGNADGAIVAAYMEKYRELVGRHLWISEGCFNMTAETVRNEALELQAKTGKAPVIFVDYLQLLKSVDPKITDARGTIDANIYFLKRLSVELNTPIIALSSFNRISNGDNEPKMQNFKESGAIEYSGDVLIGLNRIDQEENTTHCRRLELKILKNRRGKVGEKVKVLYYPAFNLFEPETLEGGRG